MERDAETVQDGGGYGKATFIQTPDQVGRSYVS
jgi:hypothetical protein